ncbi:conserved Plasmodium protein, unknown function [Plasmodium knowlesi strain H]|uniref:Uncharacterized protein n=2 Tax=Plasmodium knowlesi (strain H) TaxID=5851 RepID=A0A5E7X6D9_PLAKH|nr:conserved Plasmodium protein, unknown function [Plasmodium knowlesi strain H]CAA9989434.1 conserved Plasmodium protein, unknown function [Plasmodium knowlesi strain H]SBO25057.1 conserved Plasmodium protein, unknown function [Plasmodium knowlesi strain H]SBO27839.1 conserved Plasmodium protein, unknown function [Plasmodium knowlesi strain H]VVS78908.1 conserved Plasmodium protein, unknown function [Plasmodium knowlesi strain H]
MNEKEKERQKADEKKLIEFDVQKALTKFDMNNYNEDFVVTNNILKYHMKSIEIYNYEKNKIYDKDELNSYKDKLIHKDNIHYYPYELYFNTYRNIYKEDKVLLSLPNRVKKEKGKETEEKETEEKEAEEKETEAKDKEDNASNTLEEEQGLEDDYNFDYNKSEDELENEENDENVI